MRKCDEVKDPNSCLNRAADDELIFVLRATDVAAPDTVRAWCRSRLEAGKNSRSDRQIREALDWAETVERQQQSRTITVEMPVHYKSIDDARQKAAELLRQVAIGEQCIVRLSAGEVREIASALLDAALKDERAATQAAGVARQ